MAGFGKRQKKKRVWPLRAGLCLALLASFSLVACEDQGDILVKTRNKSLDREDFYREARYFLTVQEAADLEEDPMDAQKDEAEEAEKKADREEEDLDRFKMEEAKKREEAVALARNQDQAILQNLAYEELVREDPMTQSLDVNSRAKSLEKAALDRLGGEEGVQGRLNRLGLDRQTWEDSIYKQAMTQVHREAFEASHRPSDAELKSYAKRKGDKAGLVSFIDLTVPSREIAEDLQEELEKGEVILEDLDSRFNHDLFDQTAFAMVKRVGVKDPQVFSPEIFDQAVNTVALYYQDQVYHVVKVLEKKTDFPTIRDHVQDLYLDEAYLKYINKLAKKNMLRTYPNRLPDRTDFD